ncbi:isochorismatase [Synechococcus moorigangaii CMS01]|nr:isochorismatase [Synechococcus moorigangaii CMS01]
MAYQWPIPDFFKPQKVGETWSVPYLERAAAAQIWAKSHRIQAAAADQVRLCLLLIDVQNTFCLPSFELFVGGQSGLGAVEDNQRLCAFIYRNLGLITEIVATLDTHTAMQIFHPVFWVNGAGEHPQPAQNIDLADVEAGIWRVNPAIAFSLGKSAADLQQYAYHYTVQLSQAGKYPLTIWPYHGMLGGIGHALVPAVEEACFFHNLARQSQTQFETKGSNPLTENYSVLRPEVLTDAKGRAIATKNTQLCQKLLDFDGVIIAGQAKSHCVAWTVADLLTEILAQDPALAQKIYLLEDCTSPVVIPGVVDFTAQADRAFAEFAAAGMHIVQSTMAIADFPGLDFPLQP